MRGAEGGGSGGVRLFGNSVDSVKHRRVLGRDVCTVD